MALWRYILRCADGRYYTGHTDDLERRIAEHHHGGHCSFTSRRRPVELVWAADFPTRIEAIEAEVQVGKWSRAKKEALIAGDWDKVSFFARPPGKRVSTTLDTNGSWENGSSLNLAPTSVRVERSRDTKSTMALTPQWLDELRALISLSGVIGRTTRLTKAGHEFKACCPFHNEKSPSFTVNDAKGFYHCFGCGAHGDVIRWMTDQRGLSFMDAVKELASEAGMEVPAPDPRSAERAEQQAGLHDVMAAAQGWFVQRLASDEGAKARAYLATRGFDAHTLQRFGFGYAPEGRQALKEALKQFPEAMLIEAGLRIAVDDKEPYDRFRGRLMLPIEDARGRVIAFGGRILDAEKKDAPKYLNSPDTPLFDKGRTLYNLHRAGPASRQSGRIVVVEGYMDVIALAAAGITDAVAPLGTALTERQIEMLWRLVETPILCFDGDAAGHGAHRRAP
jgi:DNA primase